MAKVKSAQLAKPQRQTKRLKEISKLAKNAKKFQRTDNGGKDEIVSMLDIVKTNISDEGIFLSKDAKVVIAKLLLKHGKKQVAGCRKRTLKPLDEIIRLSGG
jgi:hypothetical protein